MLDTTRLIYLQGSDSDSNSGKARQFREWFPGMLTPDFKGTFEERMDQLYSDFGKPGELDSHWLILWWVDGNSLHLRPSHSSEKSHSSCASTASRLIRYTD